MSESIVNIFIAGYFLDRWPRLHTGKRDPIHFHKVIKEDIESKYKLKKHYS